MIQSAFIHHILCLLIDAAEHEQLLKAQIELLHESKYEYTGSGVFVRFSLPSAINNYKIPEDSLILNGVRIESSQLEIGADVNLFITKGVINYLEIWSLSAEYPNTELKDYRLAQIWEGSPRKEVISERL